MVQLPARAAGMVIAVRAMAAEVARIIAFMMVLLESAATDRRATLGQEYAQGPLPGFCVAKSGHCNLLQGGFAACQQWLCKDNCLDDDTFGENSCR